MADNTQPLYKRPLIKGALKSPSVRVKPPSYTERLRPKSEVSIMKQDWQSDPASEATLESTSDVGFQLNRSINESDHLQFLTTSDNDTADKVYKTTICSTAVPQPFVNPPSDLGK